ncbi:MAG: hypothetical protein ABSG04_04070, partial [Verrucomicrobiota bacterium]
EDPRRPVFHRLPIHFKLMVVSPAKPPFPTPHPTLSTATALSSLFSFPSVRGCSLFSVEYPAMLGAVPLVLQSQRDCRTVIGTDLMNRRFLFH